MPLRQEGAEALAGRAGELAGGSCRRAGPSWPYCRATSLPTASCRRCGSMLRIGSVARDRLAAARAPACQRRCSCVWSSDCSRPWSCVSDVYRPPIAGPDRRAGSRIGAEVEAACAFQWSTAVADLEQLASGRSSRRSVRKPSCAMNSRTSSAMKNMKLMTCSGLPANFLRSSGSCVATPTGQVFRWQTRIMMQPSAISGAVAKPNSSAPSSAAMTTSRPVFSWPSVWRTMRPRRSFSTSVCCVSARPSSHGQPGVLDAGQRRGAGAAVVAGDQDVVGLAPWRRRRRSCRRRPRATSFTLMRALRVGVLQVVDQLRQVLDRVDVVVRRRRDQADARRRVADLARSTRRPCGRGAGRPRRAWRPGPS